MSRVAEGLDPSTFGDWETAVKMATKPLPSLSEAATRAAEEAKTERDKLATDYWQRCLDLVRLIGEYNQKKKNYLNLMDASKAHVVREKLIDPYYGGDVTALRESRDEARRIFWRDVDTLNRWVIDVKLDVELIDGDVLLGMTVSGNERQKFRSHLKKLRDTAATPYALTELPNRQFRQTKPKTDARTKPVVKTKSPQEESPV